MTLLRVLFVLTTFIFSQACFEKDPAAQPLAQAPDVLRNPSMPDVTPPKKATPIEAEPAQQDPPGTLYTWEDGEKNISITQTPPPEGARLISKERPRQGGAVEKEQKAQAPTIPTPSSSSMNASVRKSEAMAKRIIAFINNVRSDTLSASKYYSRMKIKDGKKAALVLKSARRKLQKLEPEVLLDEGALLGKLAINKKAYAKGLQLLTLPHLKDRRAFDNAFSSTTSFRNAILNPRFAHIGAQCPQDTNYRCHLALAESFSPK